jgi:hypothetical protein
VIAAAVGPAALLVLLAATYVLGSRYGKRVGVAAALATASTLPGLLALYPREALVADALWMASLAAATGSRGRNPALGGAAAGAATLLRPAGVLVGQVIALFLLFRPERRWRVRVRAAVVFEACCAIGLAAALLRPSTAVGAGGVGALALSVWSAIALLLFLAMFLAAPFVIPGRLTALLMAAVAADVVSRVDNLFVVPSLAVVAIGTVVAMASLDGMWRRTGLPVPAIAVVAAAVVLGIVEHV